VTGPKANDSCGLVTQPLLAGHLNGGFPGQSPRENGCSRSKSGVVERLGGCDERRKRLNGGSRTIVAGSVYFDRVSCVKLPLTRPASRGILLLRAGCPRHLGGGRWRTRTTMGLPKQKGFTHSESRVAAPGADRARTQWRKATLPDIH
jgi:hypothetical protein